MNSRELVNVSTEKNKLTLSVLSAVFMGLLIAIVSYFNVPNPNMILITAMVLFTGIGGVVPGAVSAVMMLIYSMYFFSTDHSMFQYTDVNAQKMLVIIFGIVMNFAVVGILKKRRDEDHRKLVETNKYLMMTNDYLSDKVETQSRIAELTESVTSLLTNMPALTFSKEIETGKYLACNQSFAEYACKETPENVIGLTDDEIFPPEIAAHFKEDDRKAYAMNEPLIFVEDVTDGNGNPRHFQTTKQKFTDTTGRLCLLGMSIDVSELVQMRKETMKVRESYEAIRAENITYGHIAGALSADYTYLYYVDLLTDHFTEFDPDPVHGELEILRQGEDFFELARKDALAGIYEKDQKKFLDAFTKENIVESLVRDNLFSITYRLMIDGVPTYVFMKAIRMHTDSEHIVIGVRNVDREEREREAAERVFAEQTTYSRISALSGDFIVIYTIDPVSGHYIEYSGSADYDALDFNKEGSNFFEQGIIDAQRAIYPDDLEKFTSLFTRENVMSTIETDGVFSMDYRLMLEGKPVYVRLRAAMVEEKDGKQLVVGINNINAQITRDVEYEKNLIAARILANRDELTGVKNKHAYAEMEAQLDQQIKNGDPVKFCVSVFDVNDLKAVNDNAGHQAGDAYLKQACGIICHIFAHSPVYRIGGDEFAVISRGYDYEHVDKLLDELEKINHANSSKGHVVIASGMARYHGEENVAAVFHKADSSMYQNKRELKDE